MSAMPHQTIESLLRQGDIQQAAAACQSLLKEQPDDPQAALLLGKIYLTISKYDAAVTCFKKTLAQSPDSTDAQLLLARAFFASQNYEAALETVRSLLKQKPENIPGLEVAAQSCEKPGHLKEAAAYYAAASKAAQQSGNKDQGERLEQALAFAEKALALDPDDFPTLKRASIILMQVGRHDEAIPILERLAEETPEDIDSLANLASTYKSLNRNEKAIACCDRLLAKSPEHTETMAIKAASLERSNRLEEAQQTLEALLKIQPNHPRALTTLASIYRRQKQLQTALETIEKVIPMKNISYIPWQEYGQILHALDRYDEAHEAFTTSNKLWFKQPRCQYLAKAKWDTVGEFPAQLAQQAHSSPPGKRLSLPHTPVFLVGFPRSGTTLLEQMLSSHPHLTGSLEEPVIGGLFADTFLSEERIDWEHYQALTPEEAARITARYFEKMSKAIGCDVQTQRIVDKNPYNIGFQPFIYSLFPDAPVICLLRDPRDAVLSNFSQSFQVNILTAQTYSIESTARLYDKLMGLWQQCKEQLPIRYLEVHYEALTENPEAELRKILEFIDEPWDPEVLQYYQEKNQRSVRTPSYEAVTKPVYKSARGKWQNYERYFDTALPVLTPYLKAYGYE